MNTITKLTMITAAAAFAVAVDAHAQIGWTLDQCRKHWGRESIFHPKNGDPTEYTFGPKIKKQVTLDSGRKVNDIFYAVNYDDGELNNYDTGELNIPALLAAQEGVHWERDTDMGGGEGSSHLYFLGKKGGVVVFHARYFAGRTGESLEVLPIESPLIPSPISKKDTDWATANAARIEAEEKAKAAAGPTKEELKSAARNAEIRANNERVLKTATHESGDFMAAISATYDARDFG
jgi:hypothetical protein